MVGSLRFLSLFLFFSWNNQYAKALTQSHPTNNEADFSAAVTLDLPLYVNGIKESGYCNGILLSSKIIATSAHCLAATARDGFKEITLSWGQYRYFAKPHFIKRVGFREQYRRNHHVHAFYFKKDMVQAIKKKPNTFRIPPELDIALIELREAPDLNWNLIRLQKPWQIKKLQPQELQARFPRIVSINYLAEVTNTDAKKWAPLDQTFKLGSSTYFTSKGSSRVEQGDSGSGLYFWHQGAWVLAGLVKGKAENLFTNWDVFTGFDAEICSLLKTLGDANESIQCL